MTQQSKEILSLFLKKSLMTHIILPLEQEASKQLELAESKAHKIAEISIAQQRNGAVGNVQLYYVDKFSSVGNLDIAHK